MTIIAGVRKAHGMWYVPTTNSAPASTCLRRTITARLLRPLAACQMSARVSPPHGTDGPARPHESTRVTALWTALAALVTIRGAVRFSRCLAPCHAPTGAASAKSSADCSSEGLGDRGHGLVLDTRGSSAATRANERSGKATPTPIASVLNLLP